MTIQEKIACSSDLTRFTLFKEGTFFKCYNEDAMVFVKKVKPYKVSAKFVKNIGENVYSIGFPVMEKYKNGTSKASENDLNEFKENWAEIENRKFFGDKIYCDNDFFEKLYSEKNSIMFTPIKGIKGKHEALKQRDCAYENLFSRAVSSVRQPIESFFNWINQKTQIQNASNVRSLNGLIVPIFGKLTTCFLKPILNP